MIVFLFAISFLINVIAISLAISTIVNTYQRYSRAKLVVCPEKQQQATIAFAEKIAAVSAAFIPHEIRLVRACSLWPGMSSCGRTCTSQVL